MSEMARGMGRLGEIFHQKNDWSGLANGSELAALTGYCACNNQ